jgi:hypothetical protein
MIMILSVQLLIRDQLLLFQQCLEYMKKNSQDVYVKKRDKQLKMK